MNGWFRVTFLKSRFPKCTLGKSYVLNVISMQGFLQTFQVHTQVYIQINYSNIYEQSYLCKIKPKSLHSLYAENPPNIYFNS